MVGCLRPCWKDAFPSVRCRAAVGVAVGLTGSVGVPLLLPALGGPLPTPQPEGAVGLFHAVRSPLAYVLQN